MYQIPIFDYKMLWRANTYDSSQDYWKLNKDGVLIRDGRSSLYIENEFGEEFNLWDLEGQDLTEEEALAKIMYGSGFTDADNANASALVSLMDENNIDGLKLKAYSLDVRKRLGIYAIVDAESNLDSESFERIVSTSYKHNDQLGYFIDFSVVEDEMLRKHFLTPTISNKGKGFMDPKFDYTFNSANLTDTLLGFGTMGLLGVSSHYDGPFNEDSIENSVHGDNYNSLESIEYTMSDVARLHNTNIRIKGMGNNFLYVDERGKPVMGEQRQIDMQGYSYSDSMSVAASAAGMLSQSIDGIINGYKNSSSVQVPIWEIQGERFFTVIGKEFRTLQNDNGNIQIYNGPDFTSYLDLPLNNEFNNYANAVSDGQIDFWEKLKGGYWGWDY